MIELKVINVGAEHAVVLPTDVLSALAVSAGDYLYLAEMLDGSYRLTHHNQHEVEQMELVEGSMHEEDA